MSAKLAHKIGRRYKFRDLTFWAENGMIHILDARKCPYNPDYESVVVREFLHRARAINDSLKRFKYADEREEHTRLVEDAVRCCREARSQGAPDDPKTWEHLSKTRDKHLLLPGGGIQAGNFVRGS